MCATYVLSEKDNEEIAQIISEINQRSREKVNTGDIYPNTKAPVLLSGGPQMMLWGFPRFSGSGVVYNARSETALEKTMFKESVEKRRCAVPATAFFEWSKDKKKYSFWLPGNKTLYLGGCYSEFQGVRRYTILTTAANASVSPVHHRMPLILHKDILDEWFENPVEVPGILRASQPELVQRLADS